MTDKEWRTAFIEYLANKGYSEYTPSGLSSTATNYANRIDRIRTAADCEAGISWEKLSEVIHDLIPVYDRGGAKAHIGAISHNAIINAMKRFAEFVKETQNKQ